MAELADALDSGSSEHYAHVGSSPVIRSGKRVFEIFEDSFLGSIRDYLNEEKLYNHILLLKYCDMIFTGVYFTMK